MIKAVLEVLGTCCKWVVLSWIVSVAVCAAVLFILPKVEAAAKSVIDHYFERQIDMFEELSQLEESGNSNRSVN